jgi:hypothetical protein
VQPQQRRLCLVQHLARARPITHARRGHDDHEQRPERADPQVPLTPSDQLPAVKPPRARLIDHLHALPVEDRCARLRVAPFSAAELAAQAVMHLLPGAIVAPGLQVVVDKGVWREIVGQQESAAARAQEIENGIDDLTARILGGAIIRSQGRDERLQEAPFGIAEIGAIG